MDREAFEHEMARRLVAHVNDGTTDMADSVVEVPAANYTSEQRYQAEVAGLFLDHPLVLCLSGALPEVGSYLAIDLVDTPLIVTRDKDGRARCYANVCRHRGVRLVDGVGRSRRFTCPFHAWTYDLDGHLVGLPVADGFEGMCRDDKALIELPVDEGHGLIVGRLRPGGQVDIDEFLGPELAAEFDLLEFTNWPLYSEPHVHDVAANWKTTLDTYRENYHFDVLHRDTLAKYAYGGALTFDPMGPHLRNASALRSIDRIKDLPEDQWDEVYQHFSLQYAIFPNVSLTFDRRHVELWQILPTTSSTSQVLHSTYMVPGLSEEETATLVDMAPWICETVVDGEDFWVAGRTEPGLRAGLFDTVVLGRNEPALQHLHRGYDRVLGQSTA